jgi:hypothetical protein
VYEIDMNGSILYLIPGEKAYSHPVDRTVSAPIGSTVQYLHDPNYVRFSINARIGSLSGGAP